MNFIKKLSDGFVNGLLVFSFIFLTACKPSVGPLGLTIAAAANMQFAMALIVEAFTEQTGTACEIVVGSSGKLTAQIIEGAPYDILLSANSRYPSEIEANGLAASPASVYAHGKLVLWTMSKELPPSLESLTNKQVSHIALANPRTAPYGVAATEVLQHYGLSEETDHKLVFGESISQTNQFIHSQAAEIGFTALSVVLSPTMKGQGNWAELETQSYSPIEQVAIVIKREGIDKPAAMEFFHFLFSDTAQEILTEFGYSVNDLVWQ